MSDRAPAPRPSPSSPKQLQGQHASFGLVSRRITGWTTNLLFSGLILVATLGLGRQIWHWWQANDPSASEGTNAVLGLDLSPADQPLHMELGGQQLGLDSERCLGDEEQAAVALRAACRRVANAPRALTPRPGPSERSLLARLAEEEPWASSRKQGWHLYRWFDACPQVIVTRDIADTRDSAQRHASNRARRVVAWGFALPSMDSSRSGESAWTLYVFRAAGSPARTTAGLDLPWLASWHGTMSLVSDSGQRLTSFTWEESLDRGKQLLQEWLEQVDPRVEDHWQRLPTGWQGTFRLHAPDELRIDVLLVARSNNSTSGVISVAQSSSPE